MGYWQERADKRYLNGERITEECHNSIVAVFSKYQHETMVNINDFYYRYAVNGNMSYADAQKYLSKLELKDFKTGLKEYEELARASINNPSLKAEVEKLSIAARVTREQAIMAQLEITMDKLYSAYQSEMEAAGLEVYADQYYRTIFDVQQDIGTAFLFSHVDAEIVKEVMQYPFNGANYSERIWRQKADMIAGLKETLKTMMVQGKSPNDFAKQFAKRFDVKKYEARRLLYTEDAFITGQATKHGYEECWLKRYQYLATLDSKTSQICRELDGKEFTLEDSVTGENYPPMHHYCRSTTIPIVEGLDDIPTTRIARDADGKSIKVPTSMKYEEWLNKFVD